MSLRGRVKWRCSLCAADKRIANVHSCARCYTRSGQLLEQVGTKKCTPYTDPLWAVCFCVCRRDQFRLVVTCCCTLFNLLLLQDVAFHAPRGDWSGSARARVESPRSAISRRSSAQTSKAGGTQAIGALAYYSSRIFARDCIMHDRLYDRIELV